MTLQRGAPIGWEAPGEDRRKGLRSRAVKKRAGRGGPGRTDASRSRSRLVPVTGPQRDRRLRGRR